MTRRILQRVPHLIAGAVVGSLFFVAAAQAGQVVRFLGTGRQITMNEALSIAGINLAADTSLSSETIANFSTIGENGFTGCFPVPLVDPASGASLGTGIDCLRVTAVDDTGAQLEAIGFFRFTGTNGGTIVVNGLTSVRPFFAGVGDAAGNVTHMTGSIPADPLGIVGGNGAFANASGSSRVSGAVNLATGPFPNSIFLDCLWLLGADAIDTSDVSEDLSQIRNSVRRIERHLGIRPPE